MVPEAMNPDPQEQSNILIIDDDRKLCRLVKDYLEPVGFRVDAEHTGIDGMERALSGKYDAVILDIMMPGMDGLEVLRRLRKESNVPVLMFTALGEETDRIVGLELGADDYIPKTFSSRELLARIKAVIRRSRMSDIPVAGIDGPNKTTQIQVLDLVIDPARRSVTKNGTSLDLTPVEFDLLHHLAKSAGMVLSRDQLLEAVTGRDYSVFDRSIDVHISSLRKKLADNPRAPRYIRTVRSAGYMLLDNMDGNCSA